MGAKNDKDEGILFSITQKVPEKKLLIFFIFDRLVKKYFVLKRKIEKYDKGSSDDDEGAENWYFVS